VFLKYLYNYMILEYAAYYFIEKDTAKKIKKILQQPSVCSKPDIAMTRILGLVSREKDEKGNEPERLADLVLERVEAERVWEAIAPNAEQFCKEMEFDGGFKLAALLKKGDGFAEFKKGGWARMPHQLRHLRNALVHSRETHGGGILKPSKGNYHNVRLWIEPLTVVASEIVLDSTADEEL
jgi:hypothetical protein